MRVATNKSFSNFKFFLISIVVLSLTARFAHAHFFWWRPRLFLWAWRYVVICIPLPLLGHRLIPCPSSSCRLRFFWFRPIIVCHQNIGAPAPLNCGAECVVLVQRSKLDPYPRLLVTPGTENAMAGLACVPLAVVKSSSPPLITLAVVKQQALRLVLTRKFAVPRS
jgi:hypothetical protein